jgi:RNA polymerase sigma factor (sigma-70 family)
LDLPVEVSSLTHNPTLAGLRGPSPLLRLQSDERLVALTRRGQPAAFEALCSRYQARLLSFIRHMLGSREDAEDVLQEVFTAAFNAVLADEREINVRPWLYRIARNRSLNHLRKATAVGVDSMDVHFADHGMSTGDRVLRRESFRELIADVHQLPETQRSALLLREIDALSYEQIAQAMETTVPSVKSLLVRARISLAEAAEARKLSCDEVRLELGEVAEGLVKLSPPARRHVRECERCRIFKKQLKENNHALAALLPVGPLVLVKQLLLAKLGSTASAGHVAGGAGATVGAGAAAGAGAAGGAGAGSIFTIGAGALTSKAVAGLAAAAIVSAGAVAADESASHRHHHATAATASRARGGYAQPVVVGERAQPVSVARVTPAARAAHRGSAAKPKPAAVAAPAPPPAAPIVTAPAPVPAAPVKPAAPEAPTTQVTAESTPLPASATDGAHAAPAVPPDLPYPPQASSPPTVAPGSPGSAASSAAPPAAGSSGESTSSSGTAPAPNEGSPPASTASPPPDEGSPPASTPSPPPAQDLPPAAAAPPEVAGPPEPAG